MFAKIMARLGYHKAAATETATGSNAGSPVSDRPVYANADVGVDFDRIQRLKTVGMTEYNGWIAPERVVEYARQSEYREFHPQLVTDDEIDSINVLLSGDSTAFTIEYMNFERHRSTRTIWPVSFYHRREKGREWRCYIDAYDSATEEVRTFDAKKIQFIQPMGQLAMPQPLREQRSFKDIIEVFPTI